jgi:hypothetical protein
LSLQGLVLARYLHLNVVGTTPYFLAVLVYRIYPFRVCDFKSSIAFSIGSILVECWVVEESGVKVVFRALRRSGHYAVTNGSCVDLGNSTSRFIDLASTNAGTQGSDRQLGFSEIGTLHCM